MTTELDKLYTAWSADANRVEMEIDRLKSELNEIHRNYEHMVRQLRSVEELEGENK